MRFVNYASLTAVSMTADVQKFLEIVHLLFLITGKDGVLSGEKYFYFIIRNFIRDNRRRTIDEERRSAQKKRKRNLRYVFI